MQNATVVIKKLKKMLGIKTDLELSRILDVKPNTISSWKKRNSLQYDSLIALCKEHKIDLNELFFADSSAFIITLIKKEKLR
ncbi:helix-turn-helix domain-containing protein [Myroides injenensis]|uniref:helix-turn-helix domain-containing protein n=1 Tax=Myroides injenensis TaxID=1183151 RepID=UPI000288DD04|nr:helix-turn-helix domain-containing protein [Myroides injenensis]